MKSRNKPITGCEPDLATVLFIGGYCLGLFLFHVLFVGWWQFLFCKKEWYVISLKECSAADIAEFFSRSGKLVEAELYRATPEIDMRENLYYEIRRQPFFAMNDILYIRQGKFRRWVVV